MQAFGFERTNLGRTLYLKATDYVAKKGLGYKGHSLLSEYWEKVSRTHKK